MGTLGRIRAKSANGMVRPCSCPARAAPYPQLVISSGLFFIQIAQKIFEKSLFVHPFTAFRLPEAATAFRENVEVALGGLSVQ
jgi:hypothetical protein